MRDNSLITLPGWEGREQDAKLRVSKATLWRERGGGSFGEAWQWREPGDRQQQKPEKKSNPSKQCQARPTTSMASATTSQPPPPLYPFPCGIHPWVEFLGINSNWHWHSCVLVKKHVFVQAGRQAWKSNPPSSKPYHACWLAWHVIISVLVCVGSMKKKKLLETDKRQNKHCMGKTPVPCLQTTFPFCVCWREYRQCVSQKEQPNNGIQNMEKQQLITVCCRLGEETNPTITILWVWAEFYWPSQTATTPLTWTRQSWQMGKTWAGTMVLPMAVS